MISARLTVAALAMTALTTLPAAAEYKLTILHTNDIHSRIEPINKYDSTCSADDLAEDGCFGGSARLLTAIREAREAAENPILLDGGDQFQGSLFYSYYKGKAAAEMMNAMGYEAMAVGNHEFDDGPDVLANFAEAVDVPLLLANADLSGEAKLADGVEAATIVEKRGEKIGIIGLTPEDNAELSSPGKTITFTDPVDPPRGEDAHRSGRRQDHPPQPFGL